MNVELEAIIRNVITQGKLSREFYLQMADLADLKETRETFEFLAEVELEHHHYLQSNLWPVDFKKTASGDGDVAWIEEESLRLLGMMESPVGPTLHDGGACTDDVHNLSPTDSLLIAMNREENSYRLYRSLADRQPPGKSRAILEKISRMKLRLKEQLEYLYINIAFIKAWNQVKACLGDRP